MDVVLFMFQHGIGVINEINKKKINNILACTLFSNVCLKKSYEVTFRTLSTTISSKENFLYYSC